MELEVINHQAADLCVEDIRSHPRPVPRQLGQRKQSEAQTSHNNKSKLMTSMDPGVIIPSFSESPARLDVFFEPVYV